MKFGHLLNGKVVLAKSPIVYEGRTYFTADPAVMLSLGEKEVVYTAAPAADKGKYKSVWRETDTQLIQEWEFAEYTEEQLKELYKKRTVQYIREKYSINQEFAILREYMTFGESCKEVFDEYSNFVESCKARAYAEIYPDNSKEV